MSQLLSTKSDPQRELALAALKRFRQLFKTANAHFDAVERRAGISGAQLWALAEIGGTDGLTVNALAQAMAVHQSTASNLLEKLSSKGLVDKQRSETDRRVVQLVLTEAGRAALAEAPGPAVGVLPDALSRLPADKLAQLIGLLDEVAALSQAPLGDALEPLSRL